MMNLLLSPIGVRPDDVEFLYALLSERDIMTVGISHRQMPTVEEHREFVDRRPYKDWQIILRRELASGKEVQTRVGMVYISEAGELGIQILDSEKRHGYGSWAINAMMGRHPNMPQFYANINPRNGASLSMFYNAGFSTLQITLRRNNPISNHYGPANENLPCIPPQQDEGPCVGTAGVLDGD